jgi:hypothetical protein
MRLDDAVYEARTPPPGGEALREHAVDLGAVMLGCGVFLASTAFDFQRFEHGLMAGWSTTRRGALDEAALGYLLAIFTALSGEDERLALRHLPTNPKAAFKHARKELGRARAAQLERLRQLEPAGARFGPYR